MKPIKTTVPWDNNTTTPPTTHEEDWFMSPQQFDENMNTMNREYLCACYQHAAKHDKLPTLAEYFYSYIANFFGTDITTPLRNLNHTDRLLLLKANTSYVLKFYFQNNPLLQKAEKNGFVSLVGMFPGSVVIFNAVITIHGLLLELSNENLRIESLKDMCAKKIKEMDIEYDNKFSTDLVSCIKQSGQIENILRLVFFCYDSMVTFMRQHLRMAASRFMNGKLNLQNELYVLSCVKKLSIYNMPMIVQEFFKSISSANKILPTLKLNTEGFDFELTAFRQDYWPLVAFKLPAIPPLLHDLQSAADSFVSQFNSRHTGHAVVSWDIYANKLWLSPTFLSPTTGSTPMLIVTMAQALILRAFGNGGKLDISEIAGLVGIGDSLKASITPLATGSTALLFATTTNTGSPVYTFAPDLLDPHNFRGTIDYASMTYNTLDLHYQHKRHKEILYEQKINISSMIVREIKRDRILSFQALEQLLTANHPFACGQLLRKHLEELVDKEYLRKIDYNTYEYNP